MSWTPKSRDSEFHLSLFCQISGCNTILLSRIKLQRIVNFTINIVTSHLVSLPFLAFFNPHF